MSYDVLWRELEAGPAAGKGRLVRRIHPDAHVDLFLGVTKPGNRRILSLRVAADAVAELDSPPSGRGIETRLQHSEQGDRVQLQLVLIDSMSADIFEVLVRDLATAVAPAGGDAEAVSLWVAQLQRWQQLLAELSPEGLSGERQRGLYAELWLLREHLIAALGAHAAIRGWTGPSSASHDFELSDGAVEVKSTAGKQHQVLRIASERQLDDTGVAKLFLYHLSLDVRQGQGETLIDAVAGLRATLAGTVAAAEFEEGLLLSGYCAAHEPRYRNTAYTEREANFFEVTTSFPRLTEADLPTGVGDVRYSVAVAECKHWIVPATDVLTTLTSESQ